MGFEKFPNIYTEGNLNIYKVEVFSKKSRGWRK
jgi:hypothetical protein